MLDQQVYFVFSLRNLMLLCVLLCQDYVNKYLTGRGLVEREVEFRGRRWPGPLRRSGLTFQDACKDLIEDGERCHCLCCLHFDLYFIHFFELLSF